MTANLGSADPAPTAAHDADPDGENTVIKKVTADRPRMITAHAFHAALVAAGILDETARVRRVVIDADAQRGTVLCYVEHYADQRWLNVVPALDGIEVRTQPDPPRLTT